MAFKAQFFDRLPFDWLIARRRIIVCCVCLLIGYLDAFSQELSYQSTQQNGFDAGFLQDVNQYQWQSKLVYSERWRNWDFSLNNQFFSEALIIPNAPLSFRDENKGRWFGRRTFSDKLGLQVDGLLTWFSRSGIFTQESYATLIWRPLPWMEISPAGGWAFDRRALPADSTGALRTKLDNGPAIGIEINLSPPEIEQWEVRFNGKGTQQYLGSRIAHQGRIYTDLSRSLDQARVNFNVNYAALKRETYQSNAALALNSNAQGLAEVLAETSIKSVTRDTLTLGVRYDTPFASDFTFGTDVNFDRTTRTLRNNDIPDELIYYDTDFTRRRLDTGIKFGWRKSENMAWFSAINSLEIAERSLVNRDDLPEAQATQREALLALSDYDRNTFSLVGGTSLSAGRRTKLQLDFSASILRHNTPETNNDDRDMVFHTGQARLMVQISPHLMSEMGFFGTWQHTVYIKSARSIENNRQQSLRIRPLMRWVPSERTNVTFSGQIRVTYTIEDFELAGRRKNDQSARELRYDLDFKHEFESGLTTLLTGTFRDLRLGRLNWESFAEIPYDTLRTYNVWGRVKFGRHLITEIGMRAFLRSDVNRNIFIDFINSAGDQDQITHSGTDWIIQLGPTLTLGYTFNSQSSVRLEGWVQRQQRLAVLNAGLPADEDAIIRSSALKGKVEWLPNINFVIHWQF